MDGVYCESLYLLLFVYWGIKILVGVDLFYVRVVSFFFWYVLSLVGDRDMKGWVIMKLCLW